jgi:hypothetical protein
MREARAERWFKVLVLGGAALAKACGTPAAERGNARQAPPATSAGAGAGGSPTVSAMGGGPGAAGSERGGATNGGSTATNGGSSGAAGSGGDASSGGQGGERASAGAAGESEGGGAPSGGTAGAGGGGGSGGSDGLQCHLREHGLGTATDPCGCPCCWATDCLNTDSGCCIGFCKGADEGRGCCMP